MSRLNVAARAGAAPVDDPDLLACLARAFEAARATDGAFDPTVGPLMVLWGYRPRADRHPTDEDLHATLASAGYEKVRFVNGTVRFEAPAMELDLGGIAKGCALDLARERVVAAGARSALLDLGGNLMAVGRPPSGRFWEIGIKDPREPDRIAGVVEIREGSVSTSGNYENPEDMTAEGETATGSEKSSALAGLEVTNISPDVARRLNLPRGAQGVVVSGVESGSTAEAAGIREGDVIIELNRQPVRSADDFRRLSAKLKGDQSALLLIVRNGGRLFVAINP